MCTYDYRPAPRAGSVVNFGYLAPGLDIKMLFLFPVHYIRVLATLLRYIKMATFQNAQTPDIQTPTTELNEFTVGLGTNHGDQSGTELQSPVRWNEPVESHVLLPPTDTGKDAWLFLAAGFMTEVLVWG